MDLGAVGDIKLELRDDADYCDITAVGLRGDCYGAPDGCE